MPKSSSDQALEEITRTLVDYSHLRFGRRPQIHGDGEMGAIAAGLVALGEELQVTLDAYNKGADGQKEKRELISDLSHQLRTPLTVLHGYCDLLLAYGKIPKEQENWLAGIREASVLLSEMSRQALSPLAEESGEPAGEVERFELGGRLYRECLYLQRFFVFNEMSLEFSSTLTEQYDVKGNSEDLESLLNVALGLFLGGDSGQVVRVTVKGEELGDKLRATVEFRSALSGSEPEPMEEREWGSGSLLSREKALRSGPGWSRLLTCMERLRGSVVVDSSEGSVPALIRTYFELERIQEGRDLAGTSSLGKRILVVDDTAPVRSVTGEMIEILGYDVELASSGEEAIERVREGQFFELVMMDVQMPGLNGIESVREIRKLEEAGKRVCVIAMTATGDGGIQSMEGGDVFDGLLNKPFSLDALEGCLAEHVGPPPTQGRL